MNILNIRHTCSDCRFNDGNVYTSNPVKYKCTFDNGYYEGLHPCHLDLKPTIYGKWISVSEVGDCCYVCSECGKVLDSYYENDMSYCARCGAKMNV